MTVRNLEEALLHEMRDVLSAEKQITKALRKMARKAANPQLRTAFEEHLTETEGQIDRLEKAFESLGRSPKSQRCEGIAGIIDEGKELMEEVDESDVLDALLIGAAQKVEHYEIATYGTLCTWAEQLGHKEVARLLQETLEEEKVTDGKLTKMAMQLNKQAQPAG